MCVISNKICLTKISIFIALMLMFLLELEVSCADPGGRGTEGPDPAEKSQNIGSVRDTGPDPLTNHKATKPAFNVFCHYRRTIETPFKWRFAGEPMMARL